MLTKERIKALAQYLYQNISDNTASIEEELTKWLREEFRCRCSRCTGLPDIESYYEDDEVQEG